MSIQPPRRKKPPSANPAAWFETNTTGSGLDGVAALSVLALGGRDGQSHLLADGPGQEPSHGMRLPAGGFHQFLGCYAARPLQQFEDLVGFAALAGALRFLAPLGAFFAGVAFLPDLAFFFATCARLWRSARPFWWLSASRSSPWPECFRLLP